ncbi:hypothetical protein QYM36_000668 [Artemia franciscana]|uniref:E3 ubiquitin-protein ligase UBR5 n=1 Tax=Artemia franciscana TaxID=6661 RepID=A0AA88LGS2_ARTSF|nr:hypothetical protein QYM36_000668 [Artemia franciscana]
MGLRLLVHPLPCPDDQFVERLKEFAEKINKYGQTPPAFISAFKSPIKQAAVGPSHMAFLLEDGRVCRISFFILADRMDSSKGDGGKGGKGPSGSSGTTASRNLSRSRVSARMRTGGRPPPRGTSSFGTSGVIMGSSRPVYVPDELVTQAQVVLQGKSRNVIIRELQRTNLDVNLAVNNLLSRDDEDNEPDDDSQESYVPEDLISLLDPGGTGGFHADNGGNGAGPSVIIDADAMFSEDMFGYTSSFRNRSARPRTDRDASSGSERENSNMLRWRDRQYFGPRRWLESALRDSGWLDREPSAVKQSESKISVKKAEPSNVSPLWWSDEVEFWPERGYPHPVKFTQIAAMHSELIAISSSGHIYQWRWSEPEPFRHPENPILHHPRTALLCLTNEKIILISSSQIRVTVVAESGRIATWLDDSVVHATGTHRLEHSATFFSELSGLRVSQIHTSSLFTVAKLENDELYWWGVLPFNQRNRLWERYKTKTKKLGSHNGGEITTNSMVCMRNGPLYHAGAIGFCIVNGVPKVGQLLGSVWNMSETCRVKVITPPIPPPLIPAPVHDKKSSSTERAPSDKTDMPPPPSPASSTCSEASFAGSYKRKKSQVQKELDINEEESWHIKDVVFVEDVKNLPVGKVVKIDGQYAAVKFAGKDQKETEDPMSLLLECRLMRKDDLQVVKPGGQSRIPDCFVKSPRRISTSDRGQIIALTVDSQWVHTIVRNKNRFSYNVLDLSTGKVEQENVLPTDVSAFSGLDLKNISLHIWAEENLPLILDGNGTIFPITRDNTESLREPSLLDLPPIRCFAFGSQSLHGTGNGAAKTHAALSLFVFQSLSLIPKILTCDIDGVNSVLQSIEQDQRMVQSVLNERCDGGRNIIHACVSLCSPLSNKDMDVDNPGSTPSSPAIGTGDSLETLGSRGFSLREMMRRAASSSNRSPGIAGREPENQGGDEEPIPTFTWPPEPSPALVSGDEEGNAKNPSGAASVSEPHKRRANSLSALRAIFDCPAVSPHIRQLLSTKDSSGNTPFMQAIAARAYPAALLILDTAERIANSSLSPELVSGETRKSSLQNLLYPAAKGNGDDSPLYVLCSNDTCSFTWTGAEHINQDIFECRTCGLTGSLCCCTECARVCHKGHDCKLKRTSPTAYCDCWEKCKCKALIAGNQTVRYGLLCRLISDTDLVSLPNSRGENILLFLVQTVGRQLTEQRQYRPSRSRSSRKNAIGDGDLDVPDHDLEPPRFAKRALERLLGEWTAVSSMLKSGVKEETLNSNSAVADDAAYLQSQAGSSQLDKFTHCLLVKCPIELLETLLNTMIRELQKFNKPEEKNEVRNTVRRFVGSVVRVFVIYSIELAPVAGKKKGSASGISQPLMKCRRVFQSLAALSIESLCEAADSLIAPVRMGVVRPTLPFPLTNSNAEAIQGTEELFSIDPLYRPGQGDEIPSDSELPPSQSRGGAASDIQSLHQDLHEDLEPMEVEDNETSDREDGGDRGDDEEGNPDRQRGNDSDMDLDLLAAETESESEDGDNQSTHTQDNVSIQRSVQTGATAGSDAGTGVASLALFSEDDSAESSAVETEVSDNGDSDDNNDEETSMVEEQLERRVPTTSSNMRSSLAPSIQWAVRPNGQEAGASAGAPPAGSVPTSGARSGTSGGLIYMDPLSVRRPVPPPSGAVQDPTISTTAVCLSRAFGLVIRQIADILAGLPDYPSFEPAACGVRSLELALQDMIHLQRLLANRLKDTWDWLVTVMDSTEAQLRFGTALSNAAGLTGASQLRAQRARFQNVPSAISTLGAPARDTLDPFSVRRDFLSYCLSLMRSQSSEHADALPVLDVSSLKHIAYVFDALIYYMRSGVDVQSEGANEPGCEELYVDSWVEQDENENADLDDEVSHAFESEREDDNRGKKHAFFRRSESTLCLGCSAQDPIKTPMIEALPLAEQPQLLHPGCRREELFGTPVQSVATAWIDPGGSRLDAAPVKLGLSRFEAEKADDIFGGTPVRPPPPYPGSSGESERRKEEESSHPPSERQSTPLVTDEVAGTSALDVSPARAPIIVSPKRMTSTPPDSAERPPVKSVIVRAGSAQPSSDSPRVVNVGSVNESQQGETSSGRLSNSLIPDIGGDDHSSTPPINPEVSAHVTVETTRQKPKPVWAFDFGKSIPSDMLLGRWRLSLDLFGRVFVKDVGAESGSVIAELGGFHVKEARFRRDMEKIRNSQQKDIQLLKLERDRNALLFQTFKELNTQYNNNYRRSTPSQPPLAASRVKVTFKDEPGEGSGVARSFYTTICEALLSPEPLPSLESAQVGSLSKTSLGIVKKKGRLGTDSARKPSSSTKIRRTLNPDARPFTPGDSAATEAIGEHMSHLVNNCITELLVKAKSSSKDYWHALGVADPSDFGASGIRRWIEDACRSQTTREPVREISNEVSALDLDVFNLSNYYKKLSDEGEERTDDSSSLFFMPGKRGFYSPRQGKASPERLNAFRNVGRLIGVCLLQNELCPLPLNRHVIKAVLGRTIRFHDLAFYDPLMYESLRKMLHDSGTHDGELISSLGLTFSVDLSPEEGGGSYPLVPGGGNIGVTSQNIFSYVRRYAQYRMVKTQAKALDAIRSGVLDVIPGSTLDGLTAEDFRLLLNGVGDIDVQTLISFTSFNDESGESAERLLRFKKWFWAVVEKMNNRERQDLVYFWTGSPAMPASEEGFQPMPSITVRPADDFHLPTANTCISRLYVPMYSSRAILRSKLLLAIRTKNFGFV